MASKYLQKFPIPGAFPDMLHDFAREVLRDQPEDIYEYGAAYFKAMEEVSYFFPIGHILMNRVRELNSNMNIKEKRFRLQRTASQVKATTNKCQTVLVHNQKSIQMLLTTLMT